MNMMHYSNVSWAFGISRSLETQLFVQQLVQDDKKENIEALFNCLFVENLVKTGGFPA